MPVVLWTANIILPKTSLYRVFSSMAAHAGQLLDIMAIPAVWKRYEDIRDMKPGELVKSLEFEGLSIEGEMSELRGRLLRFEARRLCPEKQIPWYTEDEVIMKNKPEFDEKIKTSESVTPTCVEERKQVILPSEQQKSISDSDESEEKFVVSEKKKKTTNIIALFILELLNLYESIKKIDFISDLKGVCFFALNALKLSLYMWFLDSYIFYNKGLQIYLTVYWIIKTLYSLREEKHRIYVYIRNYPFQHQTKLLMHLLVKIMVVTFSFTCINSFVWFDNVMLTCLVLSNFMFEVCILIDEINDYELKKRAPKFFLYSRLLKK